MHVSHSLVRALGALALPCAAACSVSPDEASRAERPLFAEPGAFAGPSTAPAKEDGISTLAVCGNGVQSDGELCFLPESSIMTGLDGVHGLEIGLLNAGTHLDFAATSSGNDRLRIGLGNGTGGLLGSFTYVTGDQPVDVAVGDFNDDNLRDIATADFGADQVRVRWNTGTNWNDASQWNVGNAPRRIAAADFNGDDHDDFATLDATDNTVTVRLRNPAGGFFLGTTYAGATGLALAVADCDGDGDTDLIYSDNAEHILARRNNGAGTFGAALSATADTEFGAVAIAIATGDWNEDGDVDLLATFGGDEVVRLLGDGDCTFSGILSEEVPIAGLSHLEIADMDDDSHQDFVMANTLGEVGIALGAGDGNFVGPFLLDLSVATNSIALGDMNEDGTPDILVGGSTDVSIVESDP